MRPILLIKIVLAIGCIYLAFRFISINHYIDKATGEQVTALMHLKNDPALDSAENRKRYAMRKAEINQQIDSLTAQRHSSWYGYIAIFLAAIGGSLIRNIWRTLFRRKRGDGQ